MARADRDLNDTRNIKFKAFRQRLDPLFNELNDTLEDAYYGTLVSESPWVRSEDGWKHGVSHLWEGFDVRANPTNNKLQFDVLHGMLHHIYIIMFHKVNLLEPEVIPLSEYGEDIDIDGVLHDKVEESRQWILATAAQYNMNPKKIRDRLILKVKESLNHDVILD